MRCVGWVVVAALAVPAAGWGLGQVMAQRARLALSGAGFARAETVEAAGFPARFGLDIGHLMVPIGAEGHWFAPELRASAPLRAPLHWTLEPSLPQQLTLGGMHFTLTAAKAAGAVSLASRPVLPLQAAAAQLEAPALSYDATGATVLNARAVSASLDAGKAQTYRMTLRITGLTLPQGVAAALAPRSGLPDTIEDILLSADLAFDPAPSLAGAPADLREITLTPSRITWGDSGLTASGTVTLDANGQPQGRILLSTRDWRNWLEFLIGSGIVAPDLEQVMTSFATYLAAQSPDGSLQLPLSFSEGMMSLGPVPLGPAPRLR